MALLGRARPTSDQASLARRSPLAELGRLLFFDPILSSSRTVACATCHHPDYGWADGRPTPIGIGGQGLGPHRILTRVVLQPPLERNSLGLLDVSLNGQVDGSATLPADPPLFWDSRVRSLELQSLVPLRTLGEMRDESCPEDEAVAKVVERVGKIGEYQNRFAQTFPGQSAAAITAQHIAQAIAAFERTLTSAPTAFDRFFRGESSALTPQQKRGLEAFQTAGCLQCHGGPMFSDFKLHFIGVPGDSSSDRREFRTPTLRHLRHTAPYMHNGRFQTLRQVLEFYDQLGERVAETLEGGDESSPPRLDPLLRQLSVSEHQLADLEAFLETLSTNEYDHSVPDRVPSGLPVFK